jgi:hypothetical protein
MEGSYELRNKDDEAGCGVQASSVKHPAGVTDDLGCRWRVRPWIVRLQPCPEGTGLDDCRVRSTGHRVRPTDRLGASCDRHRHVSRSGLTMILLTWPPIGAVPPHGRDAEIANVIREELHRTTPTLGSVEYPIRSSGDGQRTAGRGLVSRGGA